MTTDFVRVVVGDRSLGDRGTVGAVGDEHRRLVAGGEHVQPGGDDLGRAAVVHRQADDLDAGKAVLDVDQQGRIGAVEPVDRLRRIADEEEVVAPGAEDVDDWCWSGLRSWASSTSTWRNRQRSESAKSVSRRSSRMVWASTSSKSMMPRRRFSVWYAVYAVSAPLDAGSGSALRSPGRRRVVPASMPRADAQSISATNRRCSRRCRTRRSLADEPPPIGDDRDRPTIGVGPALLEHAEHHRVERAGLDVVADARPDQPPAHLACRLAGERERERVAGDRPSRRRCGRPCAG